jgi:NAD(P)-dependent dehydrogenase (short-subunit alcohol dehydrogenase family)
MKSVHELMNLRGRVALVTGAGGRLGPTVCDTLAELGAAIVALDFRQELGEKAAQAVAERHGVETMPAGVDLEKADAVAGLIAEIEKRFGRLDIIVNVAGMLGAWGLEWAGPFEKQSPELFRRACSVNLVSPFFLYQRTAELLRQSGHGSIINFLSIYGVSAPDLRIYEGTDMGSPGAYAATKGGMLQMTRWLSTVLAPHIRVNAISPGGILDGQPERFVERYAARTPLGRMSNAEDLKGAVAYLASDLSQYVTGQNLMIDGGWTTW